MVKHFIGIQTEVNAFLKRTRVILKDQRGFGTIEWILLVVIIAGAAIILKPIIEATFSKIAGLWDAELVNKFNGAK